MRLSAPTSLPDAVDRFVADLGPALHRIGATSGRELDEVQPLRDALMLSRAVIDLDGMHTDEQLAAFIETFGPRIADGSLAASTPQRLRRDGHFRTGRTWLQQQSPLFEALMELDQREGTDFSWRYHDRGLEIARQLADLDSYVSPAEQRGLRAWRDLMLETLASRGIARRQREQPSPPPPTSTSEGVAEERLEDLIAELETLIGLGPVKAQIRQVSDLLKVQKLRAERGLATPDSSHHLVFTGNPGTGKTTVARLVARIYRALGVVSEGHLVETDRAGLVAGFVGQTAQKVDELVEQALGGVLLIDEAYSLVRGGEQDYGREALDALVKRMEDHRDDLVVIVAGYPDEMDDFLDANPGLRSRFPRVVHFPDYQPDQLVAIFELLCRDGDYAPDATALAAALAVFEATPRGRGFGNGRMARTVFERAMTAHAGRVASLATWTDEDLTTITSADIPGADTVADQVEPGSNGRQGHRTGDVDGYQANPAMSMP